MKVGAEKNKVYTLVGLLLVAAVVYFMNSSSDPSGSSQPASSSRPSTSAPSSAPSEPVVSTRQARPAEREFRPSVRPRRGEARPDPTTIDPTLRLEILAKLQQVNVSGTHRSIFDFGQAPPPEAPKPLVTASKGPKAPNPLEPKEAAETAEVKPPAPPQAPPVPLKFYGYISPANQPNKRAFFVEGEDIHVVREGDVVKNRYKIVRIGVNSVVVEDMEFKSQQTLPLEEQNT